MRKLLTLIAIVSILFVDESQAQQDPQYTQYMYNMNVINPAYAGSRENLSFTLLYRQQWTGLDGAPETFTAAGHMPISEKMGAGLSLISDQIGPVKETNAYADISYTLNLGGDMRLAFGVKAGATFHDIGLTDLSLIEPGDPFFSENVNSTTLNIGTGAFFYTNKYYLGLSVPNMLRGTHLDENGVKYGSETQHYFFTGGYVFDLSDNVKFKPHFMVKGAFSSPVSFDINTNFMLYDLVELGASYRLEDSFSGLVGIKISDGLRFGYAYDSITSDLDVVTNSSHEFFLTFDLNFPKKVTRSPRYF